MNTKAEQIVLNPNMIEFFRNHLYERENAASTVHKYISDIKEFYRYLNGNYEISKKQILSYKKILIEKYATSSVNTILAALNQFLDFLGIGNLKVKRLKIQKQMFLDREKEMTKSEYERLRETAKKKQKYQLALIIETLASTGARVSELAYFSIERIRSGKIEIVNKGKRRILLLAKSLQKKLIYFSGIKGIKNGCIFVTRTGRPKNRSNIWKEMKKLAIDAGVDVNKIFPHNLRHLFARTYYQLTRDLAGLADLLGHSSLDVTRIYTAESGNVFRKNIERMGLIKLERYKDIQ
ncbi:tyrosine-type recombinase/integrase [uncultured Robinsoniella sp.]|uniref:tyrosine-type recombinase/integrase n=1 Tax=uncultured Robinsoniella sp. TaxID=904190 RepID=UPI00374E652D